MAKIGVVRFAQVAREVAEAALARYRSPFSKHIFSQPTLPAILRLLRYEDWTYREAEVRLRQHAEVREALGIERVPDDTTLYRCLRRITEIDLTRLLHVLHETIPRDNSARQFRETIRQLPPLLMKERRWPWTRPDSRRGDPHRFRQPGP